MMPPKRGGCLDTFAARLFPTGDDGFRLRISGLLRSRE